jgi:pimeloyl-ACP methyl ester carboxylesterase
MTVIKITFFSKNTSRDRMRNSVIIPIVILLAAMFTLPTTSTMLAGGQTRTTTGSPPLVSTRDNFNLGTAELLRGHNSTDYVATNIPGLQSSQCPKEMVVLVHGIWVDGRIGVNALENSSEIFDRARMSLAHNHYTNPLIGFSWDSNTAISIDGSGWNIGKLIAKDNGPKLAQFIFDYMNICKQHNQDTKIRLIGHSVGARVILSALESLDSNQQWNRNNFKIASVHLLGAAVDDDEVSKNILYIVKNPTTLFILREWFDPYGIKSAYGKAIEDVVLRFYNLYDPQDKALGDPRLYQFYDQDKPLGLDGAQSGIAIPSNYIMINVEDKTAPLCDANGDGRPDFPFDSRSEVGIGDNHAGYIGFRDAINHNTLVDDGVMNVVVNNWNNSTATQKQFSPETTIC